MSRRKVLYSFIPFLCCYAVAETSATVLYLRGVLEPASIWVHEKRDDTATIRFNPVTGYRLTQTPARFACIATNGVVESVGVLRGNNQGFPDRDDFSAERPDSDRRRFAVFGDSFSAAQFMEVNWPDRCEQLAKQRSAPLDLLNFSIDGGGCLNWWTTLRQFVTDERYELDGVVFAVYGDDLSRPFTIWDDRISFQQSDGTRTVGFGSVLTYEAAELPRTFEEARPYFHGLPRWQVLSPEALDLALEGETRLRDYRPFRFYLTHRTSRMFTELIQGRARDLQRRSASEDPRLLKVWADIRRQLEARRLPALVVSVPEIEALLGQQRPNEDAFRFARNLGANYVDGSVAFEGLTPEQIRACWLPYDNHWGQTGSDRFAKFMADVLADWRVPVAADKQP